MNKRLLAGLMAFCLAAGAANAAFAEDPPLSGTLHTEIATSETAAPAEPTPVPPGQAEEDPAGENTTGDELYTPTPSTTPATTATPESADPPDDEDEPAVQAVTLRSVKIQDNIKSTGELVAIVNGQSDPVDGVTYTWYRSKTGADGSWQQVTGQAVNGSDKNLTAEHPHALNAALDTLLARQSDPSAADTDRYHYKVDVASGSSTLQAEAQVNYYVQLQNGSFEYPVVSDGNFASDRFCYPNDHQRAHFLQTRDAETTSSIYWYTTTECNRWGDGVKGKFIEIADATTTVYTDTVITGWDRKGNAIKETYTDPNDVTQAYAIGKAYDGGQFAELNCQAYGALYQDVLTVPGATLNWSLAHAGRDGTDTMALLIAPVDVAQDITDALKNKTTRAAIQEALNGSITVNGVNVPICNYIVDGNISDGCTAWGVHNGTYTVPAGQYVSRFFFVAVASASGDSEEGLKRGNLIDRVWFSTDPVPPAAGSGILRVTKTLLKTDGTALTDAEQHLRLVYGFRKRIQPIHFGFAAVKPTDGSVHGMRNIAFIRNGGGAFVKSHGNCGCERGLYLHTHLRAHKDLCTVHMRGKSHAFFLDIAQLCKRKYLKSAAVGKHGAIPIEKLMYPAELVNDILARADMKMICVGKLHLAADPFQIAGGYGALYRGACADIHKHRRENIAVNGAENACARTAAGMVYLEAHIFVTCQKTFLFRASAAF